MSIRESLLMQRRIEARMARGFQREISRAMRAGAKSLADGDAFLDAALASHKDNIYRLILADYDTAAKMFGEKLRRDLGLKSQKQTPFEEAFQDFIRSEGAKKVEQIYSTTRFQIREIIRLTSEEGLGIDVAARRIAQQAPAISRVRAAVIARTETHTAAMFGQQKMAENVGIQLEKQWITIEDDRVRDDEFSHKAAHKQRVRLNDHFIVDGEELMYPGDPSGSPGNIINCRCDVVYYPV